MAKEQYGRKRTVVGAHYGAFDFMMQRMTAVILAVYSTVFALVLLFKPISYKSWLSMFTWTVFGMPLGAMVATLAFFALAWHAFIGVRDIFMDYIKPAGIRLGLHVLLVLWLVASTVYFFWVVWGATIVVNGAKLLQHQIVLF